MASRKVPIVASLPINTLFATADRYMPLGGLSDGSATTEANVKARIRVAGTLTDLWVNVNNINVPSVTLKSRINGATGNLSVSLNSIGNVEDTTNSDSVAVGDDLNLFYDQTSGQSGFSVARTLFQATGSTTYVPCISNSPGGLGISSTNRYPTIMGEISGSSAESGANQRKIHSAGTWSNLGAYVSSNGKTTTTTFRSRINGADGNQSVSFGSGATGQAVDTSNTDSLSANDLINYVMEVSGTGTITVETLTSQIAYTSDSSISLWSDTRTGGTRTASATTHYVRLLGGFTTMTNTTESRAQVALGVSGTISNFAISVGTNTYSANATFRLRKNSANANSTVTITAGSGSTTFEDTTNSDSISASDLLCCSISGGTSGSLTLRGVTFKLTYPSATRRVFLIS